MSRLVQRLDEEQTRYVFATRAVSGTLEAIMIDGIAYELTGQESEMLHDYEEEQGGFAREMTFYESNLVDVSKPVYDDIEVKSGPERAFASALETREYIRFVKMPGWFKIETPVGPYNPAQRFSLTQEEVSSLLPSGCQTFFKNRIGWAQTYLKKAGLLETPKRGTYRLTPRGREIVQEKPTAVDAEFLMRYPEFAEFRSQNGRTNGEILQDFTSNVSLHRTKQCRGSTNLRQKNLWS